MLKFRREKQDYCHERIKKYLPQNIETAFQYILHLKHEEKPDYGILKLWLASSQDDEAKAMQYTIKINNEALANEMLF